MLSATMTTMKPYLPYARTSSDEQKDAETIKTQIASVEQHAASNRITLAPDWVMDDGVSGTVPFHERPGGARALELLRTGAYAGIICLNHKRIGRDAYVIHLAVRQIEHELRLDILAIREPVPGQIAPGARALMRAMYAGVAEFDRVEFLSWMNAGKLRAAKEGRWSGGSVPYGLKLSVERTGGAHSRSVKRLVVDEMAAPVVLRIFQLYAEGHSQTRVAAILNADGAPHPTGHHWRQTTISYMLRNPFYKGEGVWRRRFEAKNARGGTSKHNSPPENVVAYEDYKVPAIVSPELWERCAQLCVANITSASRNARRFYLLRGIVRCGLCDRSMTGVFIKTSGHQYYRCTSRADAHVENCALKDVRADEVERLVWSGIESFAHAPGKTLSKVRAALARNDGKRGGGSDARDFDKLIAAKLRERERVICWARQERITETELDAQLAQVRAELASLNAERVRVEQEREKSESSHEQLKDAESFLDEIARRLTELSPDERAAIVRRAVPRVTVTPRAGDGRKIVRATYLLSPPVIFATDRLRAAV